MRNVDAMRGGNCAILWPIIEFVSQYSDAYCYLRFCCLLDHLLFGFVPACDFDTARVFRV
jgi:hypothetical protein